MIRFLMIIQGLVLLLAPNARCVRELYHREARSLSFFSLLQPYLARFESQQTAIEFTLLSEYYKFDTRGLFADWRLSRNLRISPTMQQRWGMQVCLLSQYSKDGNKKGRE